MLNTFLIILGICSIAGELLLISFWIYGYVHNRKKKVTDYAPSTCVMVPCKGIVKNFENNIKAFCNQQYSNYNIIFITDTKEDTAYQKLEQITTSIPNASLATAQRIQGCSGKISALLEGLKHANDVEVYVFADSDIQPHHHWLTYLVADLNKQNIGATTGYRWFFPITTRSTLISAWNMASMPSIFHPLLNYTWGGSTAITKKVFDSLNIKEKWIHGYSDDLILGKALRDNHYRIHFIPQCIIESDSEDDISSFIKWGTRQMTWIRWYYPLDWYLGFLGVCGLKFLSTLGIFLLVTPFWVPGILFVSTILFEILYGFIGFTTLRSLMWYPKEKFGSPLLYGLLMPIVFYFMAYNIIKSFFKKEISWAGSIYKCHQ